MWKICVAMSLVTLCAIGPAYGTPGDIFSTSAPVVGSDPPKETALQAGDSSVSTQTGAFTYNYPIAVPPGRNGMQPHLALSYSSQAPIYGGLAAGWSMAIPLIGKDSSKGRLRTSDPGIAQQFMSSMAGGRPLIAVREPASGGVAPYRAQNDASFVRYERNLAGNGFRWRAFASDGTIYFFGDTDAHTRGCTTISDDYAPLTRVIDAFGNQVDYNYGPGVDGECRINTITWGNNAAANLPAFAQLRFSYAASPPICSGIPVGSQSSYRTGTKIVTGASQLDSITIVANPAAPAHQRVIALAYSSADANCSVGHAAFRSLSSIQESAWGVDSPRVDLPPVTFSYGSASFGEGALAYPFFPEPAHTPWSPNGPAFSQKTANNLAWGFRYENKWPTVEAMMLDVDGDGLLDRVTSEPVMVDGHVTQCRAAWQRNRGPAGHFAPPLFIPLPTVKWATPATPPFIDDPSFPYQGGPWANSFRNPGGEGCSLNYQQTSYQNSQGGPLACAPDLSACPLSGHCANGTDCTPKNQSTSNPTILEYRWMDIDGDGRVDIVASPVQGGLVSYDFQQGLGAFSGHLAPPEPPLFGTFPPCPTTSFTADPSGPYTMCTGMYPWFIYKNHGNGRFGRQTVGAALPDQINYQPVPLEPTSGESSLNSTMVVETQGTFDIDGDGYVDAVYDPQPNNTPPAWHVFPNDRKGQFVSSGGTAFSFPKATGDLLNQNNFASFDGMPLIQTVGMIDLNGDGLIDHWAGTGSTANVELNDGIQFRLNSFGIGELISAVRPGTDAVGRYTPCGLHCFVSDGMRSDSSRILDVDGDGRPDVVQIRSDLSQPLPVTFFNQGGQFGSSPGGIVSGFTVNHAIVASNNLPGGTPGDNRWEVRSDQIDLDGDGIDEGIDFGTQPIAGTGMSVSRIATPTQPPRLLVGIDNHRGASTAVTYASMTNSSVVEQHPEIGKSSPRTQWVVQNVTTTDAVSTAPTTTTTGYKYINPHYSADDQGKYGLRGFEEADITQPSGAETIQRYDYSVDWSGRLKTTLVKPAEAPTDVHSIDEAAYAPFTLFGGTITTFLATTQAHYTCQNSQSETACRTAPAAASKTTSTPTALSSTTATGGPPLLYRVTASRLSGSDTADSRLTSTTFALDADVTTYRLRPLVTTKSLEHNGTTLLYARSAQTWDPTFRVALTDQVWVDAVDAHRAITRRDYDMTTGNITQRTKPNQFAANTTNTTFAYDTRKLFVITERNELGHQFDYLYEYGTGTKLETDGPNTRTCTTHCPAPAPIFPVKEQHKIRVDGLGREIERWDTTSDDGKVYTLYQMATTSYVDTAITPTTPVSMTTNVRRDISPITWKTEKTEFDGHGRPIKKTLFTQGSAPNDQITTFQYRNDGTLQSVQIPDPTTNNAAFVTSTYTFDSLGRAKSIRRPDNLTASKQSGIDVTYDGVSKTTTEVVGAALGQVAVTKTTNDSFGRLIQVREQTSASPLSWATTNYSYGPDDNVATIVDPEHVTTVLTHDLAGHRTQITRAHGRTWKYTNDLNGNVIAEQVPGSTGPLTDADYTTTIKYDDLDRPVSKVIGKRTLSSADQALFGSGTEVYTWDVGPNQKGFLRFWQAFALGSHTPTITIDLQNNNQGQRTKTQEVLTIADYPQLTRSFYQNYYLFGGVHSTYYRDQVGGTNHTIGLTYYDARNLPLKIDLLQTGIPTQTIAVQSRNVAGLVTKRRTDLSGAMPFIESNWTYDKLGRVSSQVVQKGPGPAQVVRQDLAYFGNDDPKSLDHYLDTTKRTFQYGFDLRHELTTAIETTSPGYLSANYDYGLAGRFIHAAESTTAPPPLGSELTARNVNYQYTGTDPEQVTALTNVNGGATFASYGYDLAGNQISRTYANGDHWEFVYDGKDQLRRATRKNSANVIQGSEEYWYDGFGQRIAIVKRNATGAKTEMIWFIGDTEAHYDAAGSITHIYSHLSMGTPVARVDRTNNTTTAVEYQFHGIANNTIAAVDSGGKINASFNYAPFGEVIEAADNDSGSGLRVHRRRANDKYVDELTDLAYYGARYYDKVRLGWTQSDPLYRFAPDSASSSPRRAELYTADLNNPLRYIDPDGRNDGAALGVLEVGAGIDVAVSKVPFVGPELVVVVTVGTVVLVGGVLVVESAREDPAGTAMELVGVGAAYTAALALLAPTESEAIAKAVVHVQIAKAIADAQATSRLMPHPEGKGPNDSKDPNEGHPYRERGKPFQHYPDEPAPPDWTMPYWEDPSSPYWNDPDLDRPDLEVDEPSPSPGHGGTKPNGFTEKPNPDDPISGSVESPEPFPCISCCISCSINRPER
jgi:RHS repeat-associated protein